MEVIQWANKEGYTLVFAPSEVEDFVKALRKAKGTFYEELDGIDINVSPILDS